VPLYCNLVAFIASILALLVLLQLVFWQLKFVTGLNKAYVKQALELSMVALLVAGVALGSFLAACIYVLNQHGLTMVPVYVSLVVLVLCLMYFIRICVKFKGKERVLGGPVAVLTLVAGLAVMVCVMSSRC
jgi:hypothetical protein